MALAPQSLNIFNNQAMPLTQSGVSFLPTFAAPYKEGVSYTKRTPNCQKCGQHGRKSRLKGHKRVCPYKDCNCPKCQVVTERQKLMADQIKIRRRQRKDTIMHLTRDNLKVLNAVTASAIANPQPYINNLNNLNMLCKQIVAQQPSNDPQDVENQQPIHGMSPTTSLASFQFPQMGGQQITTTSSSAFSPAAKAESPQLVSSPLSTIGTEMSLSPHQFPRANSFDLGLLRNQNGINFGQAPQQQILSAALMQQDLKVPTTLASGFDLTPPQSAGLVAPVPVHAGQNNNNQINLALLSQLLNQQTPVVSSAAPSLLQFVTPQQPSVNLQELLLASLLQQLQGQQLSPPPEEKSPHKPSGFVDVCSV